MASEAGDLKSFKVTIASEFEEEFKNGKSAHEFSSNSYLICKCYDLVLYWSESKKIIYAASIKSIEEETGGGNFQKLIPSISPAFQILSVKCSPNGQHILLYGSNCVCIMELPRRWGEDGLFENGKLVIHCRMTMLDESFYMHHLSIKIIQADWYNGSPNFTNIIVLCNDNCMRFYDIFRAEQPTIRVPLFDQTEATKLGSISSITSAVLGNIAVAFDQGIPKQDIYPIYVLQKNGDLWIVKCRFSQNRFLVNQEGPLVMNPPSEDNYGCNYCSLICLSSNPTLIVMATESGNVHHCLLLHNDFDEEIDEFKMSKSNIGWISYYESLYVYETVKLELMFLEESSVEYNDQKMFSSLRLQKDGDKNDSYFCLSDGGLHGVFLPWIEDMKVFIEDKAGSPEVESPAEISYLLCTQPSNNSPVISICGCTSLVNHRLEPYVLCLLSSGSFIELQFRRTLKQIASITSNAVHDRGQTSPIRKLKAVGGFDTYISSILEKNATVPLMKTSGGDQMVPADTYYKLLTKTTQMLREEYMQKMLHAKIELEKRCKLLQMKKEEQIEELRYLGDNSELMERGEQLAIKLETAQEKMYSLTERIGKVIRNIQSTSSVLSTDEMEWGKELKIMKEKLVKMKRYGEVVRTKHDNMILQTIPEKKKETYSQNDYSLNKSSLSSSQSVKVRSVLKEQASLISQLVNDVNNLNIQVG